MFLISHACEQGLFLSEQQAVEGPTASEYIVAFFIKYASFSI